MAFYGPIWFREILEGGRIYGGRGEGGRYLGFLRYVYGLYSTVDIPVFGLIWWFFIDYIQFLIFFHFVIYFFQPASDFYNIFHIFYNCRYRMRYYKNRRKYRLYTFYTNLKNNITGPNGRLQRLVFI